MITTQIFKELKPGQKVFLIKHTIETVYFAETLMDAETQADSDLFCMANQDDMSFRQFKFDLSKATITEVEDNFQL